MPKTLTSWANPSGFLLAHSGTYQYRPKVTLMFGIIGGVVTLGFVIVACKMIVRAELGTLSENLLVILGPSVIWAMFSVALRFKTLEISASGINIEPLGLHIRPETIEFISFKENIWGARTIDLKLDRPCWIPHPLAFSWGKRARIVFNPRLLVLKGEP